MAAPLLPGDHWTSVWSLHLLQPSCLSSVPSCNLCPCGDWMLEHLGACHVSLLVLHDTLPVRSGLVCTGSPRFYAAHCLSGQGVVPILFLMAMGRPPARVGAGWARTHHTLLSLLSACFRSRAASLPQTHKHQISMREEKMMSCFTS